MYRAQGYPVAVIIRLHNCTDNDLVCLQVRAIQDTVQNEFCHLLALQQMSRLCQNIVRLAGDMFPAVTAEF